MQYETWECEREAKHTLTSYSIPLVVLLFHLIFILDSVSTFAFYTKENQVNGNQGRYRHFIEIAIRTICNVINVAREGQVCDSTGALIQSVFYRWCTHTYTRTANRRINLKFKIRQTQNNENETKRKEKQKENSIDKSTENVWQRAKWARRREIIRRANRNTQQ